MRSCRRHGTNKKWILILFIKPNGNPLARSRLIWEDNIKTKLTKLGCKNVNLTKFNLEAMHILLQITNRNSYKTQV
jgi:hypothetical protein